MPTWRSLATWRRAPARALATVAPAARLPRRVPEVERGLMRRAGAPVVEAEQPAESLAAFDRRVPIGVTTGRTTPRSERWRPTSRSRRLTEGRPALYYEV
jgi:hypothetical protein